MKLIHPHKYINIFTFNFEIHFPYPVPVGPYQLISVTVVAVSLHSLPRRFHLYTR